MQNRLRMRDRRGRTCSIHAGKRAREPDPVQSRRFNLLCHTSEIVNDLSVASLNQMAALSKLVCPPFFELHCSIH